MKTSHFIQCLLLVSGLFFLVPEARAAEPDTGIRKGSSIFRSGKKADKKGSAPVTDTTPKLTPYEKLFDKKTVRTESGFIVLHKVEDKLYMEIPLSLLEKDMVLTSVVEEAGAFQSGFTGQKLAPSTLITFSKTDSVIYLRNPRYSRRILTDGSVSDEDPTDSRLHPILSSFTIAAWTPDSSAVVIDAGSFFLGDNKYIANLRSNVGRMSVVRDRSVFMTDLKSFDDNLTITNTVTLGTGAGADALYASYRLVTSILLLPENKASARIADPRLGTAFTPVEFYDPEKGSFTEYFILRRDLSPEKENDPIVFYMDTLFPKAWSQAIDAAAQKWNEAFRRLGYSGDVIVTRPFPDNPEFSPFNLKYNHILYLQQTDNVSPSFRKSETRTTIDPRSGEILSASIIVPRDQFRMLQRGMTIHTAAANPGVRTFDLPEKELCEALEALMLKEFGKSLGFSVNNAAAAAYPIDSIKSASFTRKNGISASVMAPILYNYLADEEDYRSGVPLTVSDLGPGDHFLLDCVYGQYPQTTPMRIKEETARRIVQKEGDSRYFYGNPNYALIDPRCIGVQLGDDPIRSASIKTDRMKFAAKFGSDWIRDDIDRVNQDLFIDFIFLELFSTNHYLLTHLGGMYLNEPFQEGKLPSYSPVSADVQKKVLDFFLDQVEDCMWINNLELLFYRGPRTDFAAFMEINGLSSLNRRIQSIQFLLSEESGAVPNPYPYSRVMNDLTDRLVREIDKGNVPRVYVTLLNTIFNRIITDTEASLVPGDKTAASSVVIAEEFYTDVPDFQTPDLTSAYSEERGMLREALNPFTEDDVSGYARLSDIYYFIPPQTGALDLSLLKKVKTAIDRSAFKTKDSVTRYQLEYQSLQIEKLLQ